MDQILTKGAGNLLRKKSHNFPYKHQVILDVNSSRDYEKHIAVFVTEPRINGYMQHCNILQLDRVPFDNIFFAEKGE